MREMNFDVLRRGIEIAAGRIGFGLCAGDNLELELLAGSQIIDRLIRCFAPGADDVEMVPCPGRGLGYFVKYAEAIGFGRKQLVTCVGVGGNVLAPRIHGNKYTRGEEK